MPHYLMQLSYTSEAWAGLAANPRNRIKDVEPVIKKAGMKLVYSSLSFGEYDIIAIVDAPDNVSVAGLAVDFAGGGSIKDVKTTPLISWEDGVRAMRKAGNITYTPYRPAAKKTAARKRPAARRRPVARKRTVARRRTVARKRPAARRRPARKAARRRR
jgi:uncharacterized protein with GYD domain